MTPSPWTGRDVLQATGATRVCGAPEAVFAGIAIDSRRIGPDELFVALKGEVHDGHDFLSGVIERGVKGVLIERDRVEQMPVARWAEDGVFCAAADEGRRALGDLAAYHRRRNPAEIVAITGSNGKTSTRQMTVAVASHLGRALSPVSNFNNDIGVPLTLFDLHAGHRLAVLELGMNHFGEIARLTEICRPDIGVITNVGPAHLEGVGSLEGVRRAKGELLERMGPDARAVLNADDPNVRRLARGARQEVLLFGTGPEAGVRAEEVRSDSGRTRFTLALSGERVSVTLQTPARFMVSNALAAAGVGHLLGLSPEAIQRGLESFSPVSGRLTLIESPPGVIVIDDTYNANPGSMAAVIETLVESAAQRRILVIGDMKELGAASGEMHRELGRKAAGAGLDRICVTGEYASEVARGAADAGQDPKRLFAGGKDEILNDLAGFVRPGDWIAVKGSRAARMEEIVQGLLAALKKKWGSPSATQRPAIDDQ